MNFFVIFNSEVLNENVWIQAYDNLYDVFSQKFQNENQRRNVFFKVDQRFFFDSKIVSKSNNDDNETSITFKYFIKKVIVAVNKLKSKSQSRLDENVQSVSLSENLFDETFFDQKQNSILSKKSTIKQIFDSKCKYCDERKIKCYRNNLNERYQSCIKRKRKCVSIETSSLRQKNLNLKCVNCKFKRRVCYRQNNNDSCKRCINLNRICINDDNVMSFVDKFQKTLEKKKSLNATKCNRCKNYNKICYESTSCILCTKRNQDCANFRERNVSID